LQTGKGFAGGLDLVLGGVEFEQGVVLGDGFVALVEFLGGFGEQEMGVGIVGLVLDGVLAARIRGVPVAAVAVEAGDGDVLGFALFVGLEVSDLGEFAAGGLFSRGDGVGVGRQRVVGIGRAGAGGRAA
jgi:hypothetical protein